MHVMLKRVLCFIVLQWMVVSAQAAEDKGLFWRVESGGGTAYLLGAIHFGSDEFYPMRRQIMDAFKRSDVLVVEMDEKAISPEKQQEIIQRTAFYPNGETIHDHLSPETIKLLKERLSLHQIPLLAIERQRIGFIELTLAALEAMRLGYSQDRGIDFYFMSQARGSKPIREIESFQEQMELVMSLPEVEEATREELSKMDEYEKIWGEMATAWRKGDAEAMYRLAISDPLKETPAAKPVYELMFDGRNPKMAKSVENCLQNREICFVVVGAGHLVGPGSVVDLLQKQGYQVSQQ
ncbi:TraB/GumN family protein [Hahella sp. KA22]|uniref:TraB/GumN family protein n=1 Tax=Hahella sp. KA22 TaxID=1628392 RepID=UPI000FDE63E6|nr:TraB/GumN family protein [Hahella sp. KA22]AZZ93654.1 TraB/GumN family protein [Hahella sp. KA22]QAY57029.1 TraB/GumN family protein [Hahella sp. KA22]